MTTPTTEAYSELQTAYDHYNRALFGGKLPSCLITLQREKRSYGYFSAKRFVHRHDKVTTDEIAINPSYFAVVPLVEVMQTLVHEMVHAWQHHFGKPGRRSYHNHEWAAKMEAIGLMPSATGKPGGARTGEKMADYPIAGGPFMRATEQLLAQDFGISWLDRYPAVSRVAAIVAPGELTATGLVQPQTSGHLIAALTTLLGRDETGKEISGEFFEMLSPPRPANRSNRIKYRCPSCQAQVWGKPSLKLRCGEPGCAAAAFEAVKN